MNYYKYNFNVNTLMKKIEPLSKFFSRHIKMFSSNVFIDTFDDPKFSEQNITS